MSYNTVRKSFGVINLLKLSSILQKMLFTTFLHLILKQTADEIIVLRMIYF